MEVHVYNSISAACAGASLVACTRGMTSLLRMSASMRQRLLWRQMLVLVAADLSIAVFAFAKHSLVFLHLLEFDDYDYGIYFKATFIPSMSVSLGVEIAIGIGFAAACWQCPSITQMLRVTLIPAVCVIIFAFLLCTLFDLPAIVSATEDRGVGGFAILSFCCINICCYCCGLCGTPLFIRRRTCVQTLAYFANALLTYVPMSLVIIFNASTPQVVFATDVGWQLVNIITASKGAANICTYLFWVHRESYARQACDRSPTDLERAILDTYFSLSGNEDEVTLEAHRNVALAISMVRNLRDSESQFFRSEVSQFSQSAS